jgi:phosphomannomutase
MDGTLTPARKTMTNEFAKSFLVWLKSHKGFIATGSDFKKVEEQMPIDVINSFSGIYCAMGNAFWKNGEYVYLRDIEPEQELLNDLENFRKSTKYPHKLFSNYIEKRTGALNFSVLGRDCPYEERERYTAWDNENKERLGIQKYLSEKYPQYDFSLGGNISIDIVKKGCGKGQIAKELKNDYPNEKIIFFGDKTFEGGNDYELACALKKYDNTQVVQVDLPEDVLNFLENEEC